MNHVRPARAVTAFALLALAAPTPSADNAAVGNLAVDISAVESCQVTRQPGDISTSNAADLVTLQCANGATSVDPQVSVSEPAESVPNPAETPHPIVTINF
jgi:hypothetical protein